MKELDGDSLFSIFENGDQEVFNELYYASAMNNGFIALGTLIRGVGNYVLIDKIYQNRYGKEYDIFKDKLKLRYFLGLISYLKSVNNLDDELAQEILDEFGESCVIYNFQELLYFFEQQEQYEKCVLIKKYLDIFLKNKL